MSKRSLRLTILPVFLLLTLLLVAYPVSAVVGNPPVITLIGRDPTSLRVGSVGYFDAGANATDVEDGVLTGSIITTNNVNVAVVGSYFYNYSVTDSAGNTVTAYRVVNVVNALDPLTIPKYQTPLVIPPEMPKTSTSASQDYYEIAIREFTQQVLPAGMPQTIVWSYGSVTSPGTFNFPAFTIEATANKETKVKWINDLIDKNGNYLPHLLPIDQTLHWANPPGGIAGRDFHGTSQNPYTGPVPMISHLHGAHVSQESDGYPLAWYLPNANNIPAGYATVGTSYNEYKGNATYGSEWQTGTAVFNYPNTQRATTLWYHDHTMGMTRANVFAGPAGFYLLRGGPDDLDMGFNRPSTTLNVGVNPADTITEIPLAIQDRMFNADGTLFYPDSRKFFDGFAGPYAPFTDIAPIQNPEVFGDSIVVNGKTWPFQNVEQRQYRLRILNGDQARTLILQLDNGMNFTQIGAEGGFLPQPVSLKRLLIAPAERADVIVDFSKVPVGTNIVMLNYGPDYPYQGGNPCPFGQDPLLNPGCGDFPPALAATTGQVMQFRVVPSTVAVDPSTPAGALALPAMAHLGPADLTRQVSLNELDSATLKDALGNPIGPSIALLGTVTKMGGKPMGMPMMFNMSVSEVVNQSDTEIWEIYDFTVDAHPIHIHQVQFQVMDREIFNPAYGPVGKKTLPEPWETGYKDTVLVYPGQLTRVKAQFNLPGRYVWHCHILEHEDNEMMRPYDVVKGMNSSLNVCTENATATPLVGWNITLGEGVTNTTDATGCAFFPDLTPGPYKVTEELVEPYTNITPLERHVTIPKHTPVKLSFINEILTPGVNALSVCKQNRAGDAIAGWNFTIDTGATQTTDTSGCTVFWNLGSIDHSVTEEIRPYWVNITPITQTITLTGGLSGLTFINEPVTPPAVPEFPAPFIQVAGIIALACVLLVASSRKH